MRAFTLDSFGVEPGIRDDLPAPAPADDELLVRVHASSVNGVDVYIAAGGLKEMVEHEFPVTIGRDFAAFDALAPAAGQTVLVMGATGGVGSFFVQLAANAGANLIAPAFAEDHDYLRGLGVSEVVDRNGDVAAAVRQAHPDGLDAILDLVSPAPDASLLREGGRLASPLGAAGEGAGRFNLMAQPTPANLQRLAELLDSGTLRVSIQRSYGFEQAGEALQALPTTHTVGKLSVLIA